MASGALDTIAVIVRATVALVAFTVGMNAAAWQLRELTGRLALLYRSLLGVLLVMPAVAVLLIKLTSLPNEVATGILVSIIAVGPVAALNISSKKAGSMSFALGLDLVLLAASVVFVPLATLLIGAAFQREVHLSAAVVARVILPLQLLPLIAGIGVGRVAPDFAARAAKRLTIFTNLVLGAVVVLVLVVFFRPLLAVGARGFAVAGTLSAVGVWLAHLLGGPNMTDRRVLAAFMTLRFPALALAIAKVTASGRHAVPSVLAYFICAVLVYVLYAAFIAHGAKRAEHPPDSRPRLFPAS